MDTSKSNSHDENASFYFHNDRKEMLPFLPKNMATMLDVGCGAGAFGSLAKRKTNAQIWGIELFADAAKIAEKSLDRVFQGDAIEQLRHIEGQKFDCITFNDVLEHLAEPEAAILEAKNLLNDGGVIVASIPNVRYMSALKTIVWNGDFPREDYGIFDRTHLRFFTRTTIREMFETNGFRIETLRGLRDPHPHSRTAKLVVKTLRTLFPRRFDDVNYLQFAVVARPKNAL